MKRRMALAASFIVMLMVSMCAVGASCPQVDPARNVFSASVYADAVVAFEKSSDPDNPLDLVLYSGSGSCTRSMVDRYSVEGSGPAIESVFPYVLKGQASLFVIVSWEINSRGVGTYGKLYQVYAYGKDGRGGLVPNKLVSESDEMTGFEGTADDEPSHFNGKNADEVKAMIDRLGWK